jgi:predicted ATPase
VNTLRSPTIISPTLIGREAQLTVLSDLLARACSGRRIALIAGEAGIGKSRLVAEVAAIAAQCGARIVQAHCFEHERVLPYAPLIALFRVFCMGRSIDELAAAFASTAAELVKIYPELSASLPSLTPTLCLMASKRSDGSFRRLRVSCGV